MTIAPQGVLDGVGPVVTGWAWLPADPLRRLCVEILFDRTLLVETRADRYRADLEAAGKGDGRHSFAVPVPERFADREHAVDVRLPDFPDARLLGCPRTAVFVLAPVTLRVALPTDADVERLRALLAETARLNGGVSATAVPAAADIRAWLAAPDRCWLIAERRGRFVGQCRIGADWPAEPGGGGLSLGIELHPDVRGFGLGRALMLAAHRWAAGRAARMELVVLPHNERALRLYRTLGYCDLGPIVLPATQELHRHMAAPLPARRQLPSIVMVV